VRGFASASPHARAGTRSGERDGALLVGVTAPPVDGRANAAACAVVAEGAGVAKSRVTVVRGAGSRDKVIEVAGMTEAELWQLLRR
jgi:uncharacterized protein YggU (UPF0235/DUF167 family)